MYSPSLQAAQTHACKAAQEAALRLQYGQREAEPAQSEDGALFCGECDGDLPGGCPEQYRMDCLDRRAALCDVHVSHLKVSSLSSRVQTF